LRPSIAGKGSEAVPPADFAGAKSVPCPVARTRATGLARALRAAPGQAGWEPVSLLDWRSPRGVYRRHPRPRYPGAWGHRLSCAVISSQPSCLRAPSYWFNVPGKRGKISAEPNHGFGVLNGVRPRAGAAPAAAGDKAGTPVNTFQKYSGIEVGLSLESARKNIAISEIPIATRKPQMSW